LQEVTFFTHIAFSKILLAEETTIRHKMDLFMETINPICGKVKKLKAICVSSLACKLFKEF